MMQNVTVIKATGDREPFSESKVRHSIRRIRIPTKLENQVVSHMREVLYDGIPTREIYRHITEFIGRSPTPYLVGRFTLKQAIMELGPSGFPFEKFIARVLDHHGYKTHTNVTADGSCVRHEVDVVAEKDGRRYMLECKFHNRPGARSDVKVALYVQARFEDLRKSWQAASGKGQKFHAPWLITNTKFTTEAIAYGDCMGMKTIGWNHPESEDLQHLIEATGLHPITCMTTLTPDQKRSLLAQNVVLCKQIIEEESSLNTLGISDEALANIRLEASAICDHGQGDHN